ncbi:MAG: MBL fold metallo-hydrolase [Bdellovibrionales bacterium]|nr:MBL fold metallo-hydrolase [Bdellovibrionales bacterium]
MTRTVQHFFDSETFTLTYVIYDANSKDAIIIDPVLNYDPDDSTYSFKSIEEVVQFISDQKLNVYYILDTHAHADHISGAHELKNRLPNAKTVIGQNITKVQSVFKDVFNLSKFKTNGEQFDHLIQDGESLSANSFTVKALFTPGHTPACVSYLVDDMVFTGDALFMPDYGTGRCDFPLGSAKDLYHSIHDKLFELPNTTRVFVGHDYMPNGRELRFETTIGEEKASNKQLQDSTTQEAFIKFRQNRDKTLKAPRLLLPSIQINIDGGRFPEAESNEMIYLKLPFSKKNTSN